MYSPRRGGPGAGAVRYRSGSGRGAGVGQTSVVRSSPHPSHPTPTRPQHHPPSKPRCGATQCSGPADQLGLAAPVKGSTYPSATPPLLPRPLFDRLARAPASRRQRSSPWEREKNTGAFGWTPATCGGLGFAHPAAGHSRRTQPQDTAAGQVLGQVLCDARRTASNGRASRGGS